MKNASILLLAIFFLLTPLVGNSCSMYKITKNGKTIVGNNEDWLSPNSQFWFEVGVADAYGVMYMGLLNNFAQGAINEVGLVFDGFANPELAIENTEGKLNIPIGTAIKNIMQTMSTVEEVKSYIETINLSSLATSQVVFVDKSGTYLIIEGDALIIGEEEEKAFSNFYYSQVSSEEEVEIENFQNGLQFLKTSKGDSSLGYCSDVMKSFSSDALFGTQYTTIYDLETLKVRIYLFHDYSQFVEVDLLSELNKGNHTTMIPDLFGAESIGYGHYKNYNNEENPVQFLIELVETSEALTEAELIEMGLNSIINSIGYEWLNEKSNAEAAIKVFTYGTNIMPKDADLFDSLGEAYFLNEEYNKAKNSYEKSLEINPDNDNAKEYLAKIKLKK